MIKDNGQDMTRDQPIVPRETTWEDVERAFPGAMRERYNMEFAPFLDRLCAAHIRQARQTRAAVVAGMLTPSQFAVRRAKQNANFHARYERYMRMLKPCL